jgi:hypothetical protein
MNNSIIASACLALRPRAGISVEGNNEITWDVDTVDIPTKADIIKKATELQAAYDAQAYARSRKEEYDALNQFEMQYDDKANGTTTWEDAIIAIKTKYPKPE